MSVPDLAELREGMRRRAGLRPAGPALVSARDLASPGGVPLRHYRPGETELPLLVYVHGGAWVAGDLETHDRTCRRIAALCGVEVLAVEYRLAPEYPYPAAIDDVTHVLEWARPRLVAGDSAGGYLATMACLRLRDAGGESPHAQILVCPNTDLTLSQPSIREKGTGFGLDADFLAWAVSQWMPDATGRAVASPLMVEDLRRLPETILVTAEDDPLRDEGDAYAARLAEAGVPVRHRQEAGLGHGFIQNTDPASDAAQHRLFAEIRSVAT